jgi:hypothetical protein
LRDRQAPQAPSQDGYNKRFRAGIHEKSPLGVKNTFLGNTKKKK